MSDPGTPAPPPPPPYSGGPPSPGSPPPYYGGPQGPPPDSYLVWAILTTILCCLPLGVVSIVFAAQVNTKWQAGDQAGALESSAKAKKFAIWSAVVGVVLAVLIIVFYVVVFAIAINNGGSVEFGTDY